MTASRERKSRLNLLTLEKAATEIGIPPLTLLYFAEKKSIPAIWKQEGVLFLKETVDRWKLGLETTPNEAIGERYKEG